MALNFGTQGAVIVFAIAGVLNNIAFCQSGFKLLFGQKMVVFTVHFPFAHGAGGGGNGLFDLEAGKLVVLVIDVHGAANIRRMFPGATTIFLLPPSVEELERRLRGRGTETEASILERLDTAKKELAEQDKFTLTLVNDEVEACAEKLYGIIRERAGLDK